MNNIFTDGRIVYLFSRPTSESRIKVQTVEDFYPYFYVPNKEGKYVSIFGDRAKKIKVNEPQDVAEQRERYRKTFEADVHYPNRYLIDTYRNNVIPKGHLRKQYIDIEVDSPVIPNPSHPERPVTAITLWDSFLKKYYQFCCKDNQKTEYMEKGDTEILLARTEKEMFDVFLKFMKQNFPDLLMGWNAINFDFPYLINRLAVVFDVRDGAEKFGEISPIGKAGFDGYNYWVAGCSLLDAMKMYQKITSPVGKRESYALDFIGRFELGLEKLHSDIPMKEKLGDKKYLLPYNKRDVEIMVKLDEKLSIVEYYDSIRRLSKSQFGDVYWNSAVVDNLLLAYAKANHFILPTREKNAHKKYAGAWVKEPEKGIHDWVADFDATGLYPNILITFNISPETLSDDGEINITGHHFKKEPRGMYANVCLFLIAERKRIHKEMEKYKVGSVEYETLDMMQTTLKFLINSVYGVSGYAGARLYSIGVAESITFIGRNFSQWVGRIAEKSGYKFLYSDTDSVWLEMNATNVEDCIKEGIEFQKKANSSLGKFVRQFGQDESKNTLELKFEAIYERIFFGGKKRYVGFINWKKGKYLDSKEPEFRGFEVRRSDVPEIAKDFQRKFFKLILKGKGRSDVDEYIFEFIKQLRKASPEQLGFPVGTGFKEDYKYEEEDDGIIRFVNEADIPDLRLKVKREPIHMRALRYSKKYKIDQFQDGERIKWLYVRKVPHGNEFTNVVAFKEKFPDGYVVDSDAVVKRLVWGKVKPIYEALGWGTGGQKKVIKIKRL